MFKTLKTGGLPCFIFEPMKTQSLGTMTKNSAEAIANIVVNQGIVQDSEVKAFKRLVGDVPSLPKEELIIVFVAKFYTPARYQILQKVDELMGVSHLDLSQLLFN